MYYNKDEAKKATLKHAEDLRRYAALIPKVKEVIREYNNKVYNCRLEKALRAATGEYIRTEKRYNHLEIYTYNNQHYFMFARILLDDMPDNKRIPADKINESCNKYYAEMMQEATEIEQQISNISIYSYLHLTIKHPLAISHNKANKRFYF